MAADGSSGGRTPIPGEMVIILIISVLLGYFIYSCGDAGKVSNRNGDGDRPASREL